MFRKTNFTETIIKSFTQSHVRKKEKKEPNNILVEYETMVKEKNQSPILLFKKNWRISY
jgi:hypothetical protein